MNTTKSKSLNHAAFISKEGLQNQFKEITSLCD